MPYTKSSQTSSLSVKKKKRDPRKTLENKLDTLVSQICRKQGYCTICNKSNGVLNAHHFRTRKIKTLRWYLPNLVCLCVHHHTWDQKFSAHKTPEAFKKRMIEIKGEQWYLDIEKKSVESAHYKLADLQVLLEELTRQRGQV